MITIVLVVLGLILGSFVNALVWRLHEQSKQASNARTKVKNPQASKLKRHAELVSTPRGMVNRFLKLVEDDDKLSILHGRSMCPHCEHVLTAEDLIPVFSWLSLGGKCRYCHRPISWQYPLVELATAGLFVASYAWWPQAVQGVQVALFVIWLLVLVGFMALVVYDLRWFLLPNRIIYPLSCLAGLYAIIAIASASSNVFIALLDVILAVAIGGGIFYLLFQLSAGKWIGGGDVRLGWLLGLLAGTPARAVLFIFLASIIGTIVSLPLMSSHRLKRTSIIPFGPFLIAGAIITQLFGTAIIHWYTHGLLHVR